MSEPLSRAEILALTTDITSAYVSHNAVPVGELSPLIQQIFQILAQIDTEHYHSLMRPNPAVPINKSVLEDHIICLEDGKKLQMLKRYLKTTYGMTVDQYKERWGLPSDYPVVAPSYARRRSEIAKTTGLGTKSRRQKLSVVDNNSKAAARG